MSKKHPHSGPVTIALDPVVARYADVAFMLAAERPTTRAEVVAAYSHPAPEVLGHPPTDADKIPASLVKLATLAVDVGLEVTVIVSRGTTTPTWRVNAPDNKNEPGPPVEPNQYHGDVVDVVGLYGRHDELGYFVMTWHDGRTQGGVYRAPRAFWRSMTVTSLTQLLEGHR